MALTKVTGELVDIGDLDISNVGSIQLDSIAGDADSNTSITFSGSDVITVATGGSTAATFNADQTTTFSGAVTANAGVVVDNITIDGTEIDLSSGDLIIDVAGGIVLDADDSGTISFKDGGTRYGLVQKASDNFEIQSMISDGDLVIKGNDGGSTITALTLDMSDLGSAKFNGPNFNLTADDARILIEEADGTNITWIGDHTGAGAGGLFLYNHGGTATVKLTADSHANYINNGNNFGIGTTSPGDELHLYANNPAIRLEDSDGGYVRVLGVSGNLYYQADEGNGESNSFHRWDVDGTDNVMRLNSTGLGIGTTNPTAKFEVHDDSGGYDSSSVANAVASSAIHIQGNNDMRIIFTEDGSSFRGMLGYEHAGSTYMGIWDSGDSANPTLKCQTGKVVIGGDATPDELLHIYERDAAPKIRFEQFDSSGAPTSGDVVGGIEWSINDDSSFSGADTVRTKILSVIEGTTAQTALTFYTGASSAASAEKMRLTNDGKLGIGTSSPDDKLDIMGGSYDQIRIGSNKTDNTAKQCGIVSTMYTNNSVSLFQGYFANGANTLYYGSADGAHRGINTHIFYVNAGYNATTSHTEAMRINSSGRVLIGTTSWAGDGISIAPRYSNSNTTSQIRWNRAHSTGAGTALQFLNNDTNVGEIQYTNSATSFLTSSDYRLKENVVTDWDATTLLKQLKPSKFNFISNADKTVHGFLAHEVSSIVPEAVSGTKDAVYTAEEEADGKGVEGQPKYQGIDHSKLVPLLVKTIQELEARITALESS